VGRGEISLGSWREMAAIFPAGSPREPIASLSEPLRRQLRLKNCRCHVRHIFLTFPLFLLYSPGPRSASHRTPRCTGAHPLSLSLPLSFPRSLFLCIPSPLPALPTPPRPAPPGPASPHAHIPALRRRVLSFPLPLASFFKPPSPSSS
jgi:hypothetical protein